MKKVKWMSLMMLVIGGLLVGCSQGDEPESETPTTQDSDSHQDDEALKELAEVFITQLSQGEYEAATQNFNDEMLAMALPEMLEEVWSDLEEQFGNFIDLEYLSTQEANGTQVVLITGIFNDDSVTFQVAFDENQKIAGFRM